MTRYAWLGVQMVFLLFLNFSRFLAFFPLPDFRAFMDGTVNKLLHNIQWIMMVALPLAFCGWFFFTLPLSVSAL